MWMILPGGYKGWWTDCVLFGIIRSTPGDSSSSDGLQHGKLELIVFH